VLSARRIICLLAIAVATILPSTALAGGEIVGTYICPLGMEVNETAKFCQTPDGKQIAPVHGHTEVIHSGEAHNSTSSSSTVSISSSTAEYRVAGRLAKAAMQGRCPLGLICHHNQPQERKVRLGDTLWGLASYYLGNGQEWTQLCTPKRGDPTDLQVGEFVAFC
jgi:hypothetical protein